MFILDLIQLELRRFGKPMLLCLSAPWMVTLSRSRITEQLLFVGPVYVCVQ